MGARKSSKSRRRKVYAICTFSTVVEHWSGSTYDKSSVKYLIILDSLNKFLLILLPFPGHTIVT
jgi:hypothetical protein